MKISYNVQNQTTQIECLSLADLKAIADFKFAWSRSNEPSKYPFILGLGFEQGLFTRSDHEVLSLSLPHLSVQKESVKALAIQKFVNELRARLARSVGAAGDLDYWVGVEEESLPRLRFKVDIVDLKKGGVQSWYEGDFAKNGSFKKGNVVQGGLLFLVMEWEPIPKNRRWGIYNEDLHPITNISLASLAELLSWPIGSETMVFEEKSQRTRLASELHVPIVIWNFKTGQQSHFDLDIPEKFSE